MESRKWELRGPPFLEYTPVGVHTRCSTLDLFKKLGGILTSITRLMLDFGPAHPCKPSLFPSDFSSQKCLWTHAHSTLSSEQFWLKVLAFFLHLIGDLECIRMHTAQTELRKNRKTMCVQSKLQHMSKKNLLQCTRGFSAIFRTNFVTVKILRVNWACCNYKYTAEAELSYFACIKRQATLIWGC